MTFGEIASAFEGFGARTRFRGLTEGDHHRRLRNCGIIEDHVVPVADRDEIVIPSDVDLPRFAVEAGDLLLAMKGDKPKLAIVPQTHSGFLADNGLAIIRAENEATARQIHAYLASPDGQEALQTIQTGAAIRGISAQRLRALEIRQ